MRKLWIAIVLSLVTGVCGCDASPNMAEIAAALQKRMGSDSNQIAVREDRLHEPRAVARFYRERKGRPAWTSGATRKQLVEAIEGAADDGLDPSDYHLQAIRELLDEKGEETAERAADLDILLSDAAVALFDDMRFGKVTPRRLNPAWNVDPREEAPPPEQTLTEIASSSSPARAIQDARPRHFIYEGLVGALRQLRDIQAKGGWPSVPAGRAIKPGTRDPRIPAVRRRLLVSGELRAGSARDSLLYDRRLRSAVALFQARHRLDTTAVIGRETIAEMNVSASTRASQVRANLERARWVLPGLSQDFLLVNLPAFKAYLIRGGNNVWEARTMIGQEARQTPSFQAKVRSIVFNPDWTVPPTILEEDVLEGMRRGENMIAEKKLVILDSEGQEVDPGSIDWGSATPETFPYTLRQPPGADNALGRLKFLFPNKYSIYLHDTPAKTLFKADERTFSSGCIRIERPQELAALLLQGQDSWGPQKIQSTIDEGETREIKLDNPLPILIVYWTVSVGRSGEIRYGRDVYDLDPPLIAALKGARA